MVLNNRCIEDQFRSEGQESPFSFHNYSKNCISQPILPSSQPILPNSQPIIPNSQPMLHNLQPMLHNSKPIIPNSQPILPNSQDSQPIFANSQPIIPNSQPMLHNSKPIIPNSQPIYPNSQDSQPIFANSQPNTSHQSSGVSVGNSRAFGRQISIFSLLILREARKMTDADIEQMTQIVLQAEKENQQISCE